VSPTKFHAQRVRRLHRLPRSPWQRIRLGALFLVGVIAAGVVGYRLSGRSWLDSLYMVIITVSTVGYGEQSTLPPTQQWLTMGVITFGMFAAAITIGGLVQMVAEGEVDRILSLGRMNRDIERLKDHIIVCGFGRIGRTLVTQLQQSGLDFLIIDSNTEQVTAALDLGYLALHGNATEEEVLQAAGIGQARCLVTALANDAANVFITLTSRNLNPKLQIIARGEQQSTEKKLLQAGANRVVLPAAIGARRMSEMITHPSTVELMDFMFDSSVVDVNLDEIHIGPSSPLAGQSLKSLNLSARLRLLVIGIKHAGGSMSFNPDGQFCLAVDDVLIVMGRTEDISRLRQEAGA
jgi:voltage-gated potassium channel